MRRKSRTFDSLFQYWAILPTIIVLILLTLYPGIRLVILSLSHVVFASGKTISTFVGLHNFHTMFADPVVGPALVNTVIIVVVSVVVETVLGTVPASFTSNAISLNTVYRTLIIFPLLIPPIAIGVIWFLLYNYSFGGINQLIALFGVTGPAWLANPSLALWSVVILDVWHWTSFLFLIILAGIESLPQDTKEAARIDGASETRIFFSVTLPLLRPTLAVAVMLRTIFAFKIFDEIYLLTSGGPGTRTQVVSLYIEQVFFNQFQFGYASSLALSIGIIVAIFVIVYRRFVLAGASEMAGGS